MGQGEKEESKDMREHHTPKIPTIGFMSSGQERPHDPISG
jgi:hypothetical protein